uniref:Uncharacterized protein n=1 Tax=Zea mays TaxID=4577 RepID=C4J154_MAIZE|nr:unknown [Zea mays]
MGMNNKEKKKGMNRARPRSMAMAVGVAMAALPRRARARAGGPGLERRRRHAAGSPELLVPAEVEAPGAHHALLLGREPALEEAFERRLLLGAEEEGVAGHEVHGRDVEADGLHHVPRQLPEGEPHEPGRLDHQVRQPAPQLPPHPRRRRAVDLRLLRLHGPQLLLPRGVDLRGGGGGGVPHGDRVLDCLHDHVGPEEDGLSEHDDGSGLVERARDGGARVRAGGVAAEAQEVGVRHGAGAGLPNPRAGRLHLCGAQHLARLLHREARRGQRRVRLPLGRRRRRRGRHEAVEVDPRECDADPEVPDPVGQGHEAVGRHGGAERRLLLQEPPEPERRRRRRRRRREALRHGSPQHGRHCC